MSKTIIFFGSGPVAAKSLSLLSQDFTIEAVVTKPIPAHHKGNFPVLDTAKKLGLEIITTSNKQELSNVFEGNKLTSNIGVVIDYGIIIGQDVIDFFPLGIINSHFSLLPQWRGPDPITFSILSGQKQTGVSLMKIVEALDEGPLLAQSILEISPSATTPMLTDELIELSHEMLKVVLPQYVEGKVQLISQYEATLSVPNHPSYSRKLAKSDGILDFTKPASRLEREVLAYIEWPRSRTKIAGVDIVVTKAHAERGTGQKGKLWTDSNKFGFHTPQGVFVIDTLIPAGRKEMSSQAFLAGYNVS